MQNVEYLSHWYGPGSHRAICTPSSFARQHLFYAQEIGHIKRLNGNHERQRGDLNSYLFVAVCTGEGELACEGTHYRLAAGNCFWIDCRREHSYQSSDTAPWELRWVHFNGLNAPAYYKLFREQHSPVFRPDAFPEYGTLLGSLFSDADDASSQTELLQSGHIQELLTRAITSRASAAAAKPDARIQAVRDYLAAHFTECITLDGLAQQFLLSKFYLARQFKLVYETTVFEFLISRRITYAKQLLRETDDSIAEIALACGYTTQSFFSRQFLKVEGLGPAAYRKAWK
jgi:AraC-like DNA-binding protein